MRHLQLQLQPLLLGVRYAPEDESPHRYRQEVCVASRLASEAQSQTQLDCGTFGEIQMIVGPAKVHVESDRHP